MPYNPGNYEPVAPKSYRDALMVNNDAQLYDAEYNQQYYDQSYYDAYPDYVPDNIPMAPKSYKFKDEDIQEYYYDAETNKHYGIVYIVEQKPTKTTKTK